MIKVILNGGLGNQMFEYATAKAAAIEKGREVVLDLSFSFLHGKKKWFRPYELDVFRITSSKKKCNIKSLMYFIFEKLKLSGIFHVYDDERYRAAFYGGNLKKNMTMYGYFQNIDYFEKYREKILDEFTFALEPTGENLKIAKEVENINSVSVHVRRGDYIGLDYIEPCSADYYKNAMNYMRKNTENPVFFIFSDDIEWCVNELKGEDNVKFVNINSGKDSYNDMRLMSLCKHNIIANSTFSWWGAWLNRNREKIIIAPRRFFKDEAENNEKIRGIIPQTWILM